MWLDKAVNDPIVAEIQRLQKIKCQSNDYNLVRECNRKIDLLVNELCNKYLGDIINEHTID